MIAIGVRTDRSECHRPQFGFHHQVGDQRLVLEGLAQPSQILLAFVKLHRGPGRGVGIGVEVVDFLAVEPVRGDLLIDNARGDANPSPVSTVKATRPPVRSPSLTFFSTNFTIDRVDEAPYCV